MRLSPTTLMLLLAALQGTRCASSAPNIVIIYADDLRNGDLAAGLLVRPVGAFERQRPNHLS